MSTGDPGSGPNILLITADQWRGDCLSAVGHRHALTPNLDALARRGVLFERHYANSAPCAPARACLYTGLYQMNHRVCINGTPLDARHDNVAHAARRAGYTPVLFGYTDTAVDPRTCHPDDPRLRTYEGVLPGFDVRLSMTEEEWPWRTWLAGQGVTLPEPPHRAAAGVDDPPAGRAPRYSPEQSPTAYLVEELVRWLDERRAERRERPAAPWFAHLSLLRPHPPFVVPPPYGMPVDPADIPPFAGGGHWQPAAALHPYVDFVGERQEKAKFIAGAAGRVRDWSPDDLARIAATYFGMVSEVDARLGRLFAHLDATGFREDTLIVVTSDHGELLGDHGLLGKGGFFDASYHVPLIVSDPRRPAAHGRRVRAFTESVDVLPTLLETMSLPLPVQLDGCSLAPWIGNETPAWRTAVHWEHDFRDPVNGVAERRFGIDGRRCNLSVHRDEKTKYVHFAALPPLLFDLAEDPQETRDLSGSAACRERRLACAEALLDWRAAHLDQTLASGQLTPGGWVRAHGELPRTRTRSRRRHPDH